VGTTGSGINGRFEEVELIPTPIGELGLASFSSNGAGSDRDFTVSNTFSGTQAGNGDTLYRLRVGIERFLITDINNPAASAHATSDVPVLWDHISTKIDSFAHVPGGGNVLYFDGHVEFIRYPGLRFPMTENSARIAGRNGWLFDGPPS